MESGAIGVFQYSTRDFSDVSNIFRGLTLLRTGYTWGGPPFTKKENFSLLLRVKRSRIFLNGNGNRTNTIKMTNFFRRKESGTLCNTKKSTRLYNSLLVFRPLARRPRRLSLPKNRLNATSLPRTNLQNTIQMRTFPHRNTIRRLRRTLQKRVLMPRTLNPNNLYPFRMTFLRRKDSSSSFNLQMPNLSLYHRVGTIPTTLNTRVRRRRVRNVPNTLNRHRFHYTRKNRPTMTTTILRGILRILPKRPLIFRSRGTNRVISSFNEFARDQ